jgi:Flp pilus assembly protein TadD
MKILPFILISFLICVSSVVGQTNGRSPRGEEKVYSLTKISKKDAAGVSPAAIDLNNLAADFSLNRDFEKAVEGFRRAAEMAPASLPIQTNLANALMNVRNYAGAAAVCRKIIDSGKAGGNVYFILGNAQYELGNYSESVGSYRKALEFDARNALLINSLGLALYQTNSFEAIEAFEAAIKIDRSFADPYNNLAVALIVTQRYKEAVPKLESAIALKPEFAEAHNNLGHAFYYLGKPRQAQKSYQEAVRLKPECNYARYNLAMSLLAQGKREDARTHLTVLQKTDLEMARRLQKEFDRRYVIDAAKGSDSI